MGTPSSNTGSSARINTSPSLLRIGLTAGFLSLSQQRDKKGGGFGASSRGSVKTPAYGSSPSSTTNDDTNALNGDGESLANNYDRTKGRLLSSPEDEAATMAIIEAAQSIANIEAHYYGEKNDELVHPITISSALSALGVGSGGYSTQSSRGVLVNVIDPSTTLHSKTIAVDALSSPAHNFPDTPPPLAKGLFGGFRSGGGGGGGENSHNNNSSSAANTTHSNNNNHQTTTTANICKNIYEKLTSIFSHNYNSTLHSLPYIHPRTSMKCHVSSLPVHFALTMQPASDPADWHTGPYCHIYIAAVENVEHYRAKVRPALRAFVNQIEGSGTMAASSSSSNGGSVGVSSVLPNSSNIGSTVSSGVKQPRPSSAGSSGGTGGGGGSNNNSGATPIKGGKSANEKALARAGLLAGKSIVAGNFGSRYIIVFVPIGAAAAASASSSSAPSSTAGAGVGRKSGTESVGGSNHSGVSGSDVGGGVAGGGGGFGGFRAGKRGQSGGVVLTSPSARADEDSKSLTTIASPSPPLPPARDSSSNVARMDDSHHSAAASAAHPPGPIAHSSKEVKELYQKFLKDFPNGRTVILGTLLEDTCGVTSMSPLKNQEWKAFLHNLGSAIVDGFQDRVRRYDEELRRLDSERAAFVRKLSGDGTSAPSKYNTASGGNKDDGSNFDLSHFFLVKESLAFTYEQMQLFEEAKLQYEELSAFLPEDAWRNLVQRQRNHLEENEEDRGREVNNASPLDLAIGGNSSGFRHYIKRSGKDLRGVSEYVPHYMFAREVRLLFQMGTSAAVDALVLSKDYLVRSYRNRLLEVRDEFQKRWKEEIEGAAVGSPAEEIFVRQSELRKERLWMEAEVESRALSSCWDIKISSGQYFTLATKKVQQGSNATDAASMNDEVEAARCLAELIEFATNRLLRLGDLSLQKLGGERDGVPNEVNPIRQAACERPLDTQKQWQPWQNLQKSRLEPNEHLRRRKACRTLPPILPNSGLSRWLYRAMETSSMYEEAYLELTEAAVCFNRAAGRFRFASRIEDHRAEVLIARGDFTAGARVLSQNVGTYAQDQWTRAHYWRIFRLACCQRMSGDVLAYLETLSQSFNPKLSAVAPKKTASLFQQDLEAIISDAAVADQRWGAFSFLETEISFESDVTNRKSSQPLPFVRRNLTKHRYFVGDELAFTLNIRSHLPRPITVNGVRLYVVTLKQYELVHRRNGIVTEEDAFRILVVDAPIQIMPGPNAFTMSWQPMTSNLYVLACVEIQWKEASFFYDSATLRKPIFGLDIQPSEPTQTLELNPLFLIPGHVQNVRLVIHSGSDVITQGQLRLVCSKGLLVVPPNTITSEVNEAWSDECTIPLSACEPGNKIVITILVKSSTIDCDDGGDTIQTMWAKVETLYRHKSYRVAIENGDELESDPMKTVLEAMVTTLDRPALTVHDTEAVMFGDDHVMVKISLQCNSPVLFYIKEWQLDLPPPLLVEADGDLSNGMFQHAIPEGDILLFGFKCVLTDSSQIDPPCTKPMLRIVLKDEFGKTFVQILPVNLEDVYNKVRKDSSTELFATTAELTCSVDEGSVGHPVPFVYTLNLSSLMTPRQRRSSLCNMSVCSSAVRPIQYTIVSEGSEWIVSGKVQGLIKPNTGSDSLSIHFRGIPTNSGILRDFPALYLDYLPIKDSCAPSPPIFVQCKKPDSFQSFAYTTSLSLAVPAALDEF
ncbi:hypothetical protein ACHAXH_001767 [Discostella pseudostelligera]